jgi:hypothetical protein
LTAHTQPIAQHLDETRGLVKAILLVESGEYFSINGCSSEKTQARAGKTSLPTLPKKEDKGMAKPVLSSTCIT